MGNSGAAYVLGQGSHSTAGIHGLVEVLGSSGGVDSIIIDDQNDATGRTVHVDQTSIGAGAGDNLLGGAGGDGSVSYSGITGAITLQLGSGSDTIFAKPVTASLNIDGHNPTVAPGDTLNAAMATAINPVHTPSTPGNGFINYDNGPGIAYTSIETVNYDPTAPQALDITFDPTFAGQALAFLFDENVSASLSGASLVLNNETTLQQISADFAFAANTATFTFPGSWARCRMEFTVPCWSARPIPPATTRSATATTASSGTRGLATPTCSASGSIQSTSTSRSLSTTISSPFIRPIRCFWTWSHCPAARGTTSCTSTDRRSAYSRRMESTLPAAADSTRYTSTVDPVSPTSQPSTPAKSPSTDALRRMMRRCWRSTGMGGTDTLVINAGNVALPTTQQLESLTIAPAATATVSFGLGNIVVTHALTLDNGASSNSPMASSFSTTTARARSAHGTARPTPVSRA